MSNQTKRIFQYRSNWVLAALIAILIVSIGTPLRTAFSQAAAAPPQSVAVANAMAKIHPTDTVIAATSAEIHAAQNEFEAFQLVVVGPVTGVSVTAPSLSGPNGATIPASEVRLYREGYQNITTASNTEGGTGMWPDALIPDVDETANEKRNAFPFDVPSGENRVVWVEVHVPQGQTPGTYQGSVTVTGSGLGSGSVSVPVNLLVWDFALPSTSSLPSTFGMGWNAACIAHFGSYTACGGDAGVEKMRVLYSRFMLDHRITADVVYTGPTSCSGTTCDWSHFDSTYGALFDGTDPSQRLQGAKQTTILYRWNASSSTYFSAWAQHFHQKGWFDRTYDYSCDEPPAGCAWSGINTRATMVHAADPDFRTLVTTTINEADANAVTNSINILAPVINHVDDKSGWGSAWAGNQRPNYNSFLQLKNNNLWWYQSCMSHGCNVVGGDYFSNWPSFMVDDTAAQNRAQGMQSWLYDVRGVLYFTIDDKLATAWSSVYDFGGNGDGTLLYPGKPSIIGGQTDIPVASIRLKMIREGFEDYEYMKLVSDLGDPTFAQQTGKSLMATTYSSKQAADAFYSAREALANRILTLKGSSQASSGGSTGGTTGGSTGGSTGGTTGGTSSSTVTRIEQNDPSVIYTGTWSPNSGSFNSGGSAALSASQGARASFTFTGTGVAWIGYRDEWSGIANVYLDGTLKATVDTYATPAQAKTSVYSVSGLTSGSHTLIIEATGTKSAASSQAWVWVDAFDVTADSTTGSTGSTPPPPTPPPPTPPPPTPPPPTSPASYRIEQTSPAVQWSGSWSVNTSTSNSGGSAKLSMTTGARATFTFSGTSVSWIGYSDQRSGIARVYIDGTVKSTVDTYASAANAQAVMYTVSGLTSGTHTIAIEVTGTRRQGSKGKWVWVDAFDYTGAALSTSLSSDSQSLPLATVAGGEILTSSDEQSLLVGSGQLSPAAGNAPSGVAIFGYRQNGILTTEAGVPASIPALTGRVFAEVDGAVNTGLALANPNETGATVSFSYTDRYGTDSSSGSLTIPPHGQVSRFLDEAPFRLSRPSMGSLSFSSNVPVAAIALRALVNERSEFLMTTLPIANPDLQSPATAFFPHFADGGGWSTQFVLINPSDFAITGTLNLFAQGTAGTTANMLQSIPYNIPARSSTKISTPGTSAQMQVGSANATPDVENIAPVGVTVFSFRRAGVTVSEAGTPSSASGNGFRMYVEATEAVRSGIAIQNAGQDEAQIQFDLTRLDGTPVGLNGSLKIPGMGQRAVFLNEIPGFESLATSFQGILRVHTNGSDIAVLGLRGHNNERGDFLMTTTPPTNEDSASNAMIVFPHIVDGAGYTSELVTFSGTPSEDSSGNLQVFAQSGDPSPINLHRQ
jgi:Glycoside hydrolase 123 N-terminal domain/Glycoside hydrolase 123, catalytic domain